MGRVRAGTSELERIVGEFYDFLPHVGLVPNLTPEEVERFVALGEEGRVRSRAGDAAGAARAFEAQIAIFPPNPEPWLMLAMVEAGRGNAEAALGFLRAAVVRGFTDLRQVQQAEAWAAIGRPSAYLELVAALPELQKLEQGWPDWDAVSAGIDRAPGLDDILDDHEASIARIEAMAPAIGPRATRLWTRMFDSGTAARLDAYAARDPEPSDLEAALRRLMSFYARVALERWGTAPAGATAGLARAADLILQRFPGSAMRPEALVARAVGQNVVRDRKGLLDPQAGEDIGRALGEVVAQHGDSPVLPTAIVGLVLTELELGRGAEAAALYAKFRETHAAHGPLLERVRDDLGETALRLSGLPAFEATTLDGRTLSAAALRGRVAVVDFWATWCGPCVEQLPALRRIEERHGDEVVVLGVNLNADDELSSDALREWIAREAVPGEHVHDGRSWDSELVQLFGVKEIPFTVVIGPGGEVLALNPHGRQLERTVQTALRERPAMASPTVESP